jgi:hypothetical protein
MSVSEESTLTPVFIVQALLVDTKSMRQVRDDRGREIILVTTDHEYADDSAERWNRFAERDAESTGKGSRFHYYVSAHNLN